MTSTTAIRLTDEQRTVVQHPRGRHAVVAAVAGSGKTSTMVERVRWLLEEDTINPERLVILMFNVLARQQFKERVVRAGLPNVVLGRVFTFHSFAYSIIKRQGLGMNGLEMWIEDKEEMRRYCARDAIRGLEKKRLIVPNSIAIDDLLEDIGHWKANLIPPTRERAGHRRSANMPLAYMEFERLRTERRGLTFDDFVPEAVRLLEGVPAGDFDAIIVDEYQDVNFGQQRLVELIAGDVADVMVVGDDDQTIYEWRGARPQFIRGEFSRRMTSRPTEQYALTHSFRFGPLIAQCADNCVVLNSRMDKSLVAHDVQKRGDITVHSDGSGELGTTSGSLVDALKAVLVEYRKQDVRDLRECVVVLGRTFAQLASLEADMLRARLPYRVLGKRPFFERREVVTLLRYAALGLALDEALTKSTLADLRQVANVPRRLIPDRLLELIEQEPLADETLRDRLCWYITDVDSPAGSFEQEKLADLFSVLERLARKLPVPAKEADDAGIERQLDSILASDALKLVVEVAQLDGYYRSFYSGKLESEDRLANVQALIEYAATSNESIRGFLVHIAALDSTWGRPIEQQILMTTVFRTKGLEYDHVFIPECVEGMMPCTSVEDIAVFDKAGLVPELEGSNAMENERRLFYVAITRAKVGVHIGTRELPSPTSSSGATGPMPSRFLFEMRAQRTRAVVDQLQVFGATDAISSDPGALLATVFELPVMASALKNLARTYLPAIGAQSTAERLRGITVPVEVMVYPRALAISEEQQACAEKASASMSPRDDLPPLDFLD